MGVYIGVPLFRETTTSCTLEPCYVSKAPEPISASLSIRVMFGVHVVAL